MIHNGKEVTKESLGKVTPDNPRQINFNTALTSTLNQADPEVREMEWANLRYAFFNIL